MPGRHSPPGWRRFTRSAEMPMTGGSTMPGNNSVAPPSGLMTPDEVAAYRPHRLAPDRLSPLERARAAMRATGQWSGAQAMGRRWAIGCVALEVTQRCNLDCTLCYLSESSESAEDPPIREIFERIDRIRATYGPGVGVQVTGGDPTLRRREELVAIVRRLSRRGLRP